MSDFAVSDLNKFAAKNDANQKPVGAVLESKKNCVALTFSKCFKKNAYTMINYFVEKKWISKGKDLENDETIERVLDKLGLRKVFDHTDWGTVKIGMKGHKAGRYFCINRAGYGKKGDGHAFTVIVNGKSVAVSGNNQEKLNNPYAEQIQANDKVTVWGPAPTS
ncbi:hypothetical protein [Tropicimonas sp. IMCC6043]|uniref:hypothetical protein n=1 Tax=Tropicimonas sp. IMCC6043 TaxID=2510645 RepID=UPI00101C97A7|nr:hypothetical protein [Tropicimonas sp. IMCC6043]RYH11224.1 hypothetical protein EU800_05020 [Tropicimonas sp. IMCC6043]